MKPRKVIALCVCSFGIGFGSQFVFPNLHHTNWSVTDHHTVDDAAGHAHQHTPFEIPAGSIAPRVTLDVQQDAMAWYNLLIATENFRFAPEKASVMGDKTSNEGHAHLYVNGEKKARVYGNAFHLPAERLTETRNMVTVSLNTNDHDQWTENGIAIEDSVIVELPTSE